MLWESVDFVWGSDLKYVMGSVDFVWGSDLKCYVRV